MHQCWSAALAKRLVVGLANSPFVVNLGLLVISFETWTLQQKKSDEKIISHNQLRNLNPAFVTLSWREFRASRNHVINSPFNLMSVLALELMGASLLSPMPQLPPLDLPLRP